MKFDYKFAMVEYNKIKKYLEKYGYKCEVTGSLRRKKEKVGDVDIVVKENKKINIENLKRIEKKVLEIVSKYSEIEKRINYYEFLLKSGISIHIIPEISMYFNYTLWNSTGPKLHVKLIKKDFGQLILEQKNGIIREKHIKQVSHLLKGVIILESQERPREC